MAALAYLFKMLIDPRGTSREILEKNDIKISLCIVLNFGIIMAAGMLISYFTKGYPPPPQDLKIWIEAWGEFTMLPFLKLPAESYRLVQAIFMIPLVLAIWILMAGSARLLSALFGGKSSFDQFASLFGLSFFVFWIIASIFDTVMSGVLGGFVLAALRLEYGVVVKDIISAVYPLTYIVLFGLGGIYNAIVVHEADGLSVIKTSIIGLVTFAWPVVLIALLLR